MTYLMTSTTTADSWMAMGTTQSQVATAMMASSALTQAVWKRLKWSTGTLTDTVVGRGVGEGLGCYGWPSVRGLKGRRLLMPKSSREIETLIAVSFRFPTPLPLAERQI